MNPAIHDAYATELRRDRERAAARACSQISCSTRLPRAERPGRRERLGRALIAAGTRLAH